jgi:spore germination protein
MTIMHKKLFATLAIFLTILMLLPIGCAKKQQKPGGPSPTPPAPAQQQADPAKKMVIGYYENPWPGNPPSTGSFPTLENYHDEMTGIAPFWYTVQGDGSVTSKESQQVIDFARSKQIKMYALVTNKHDESDAILKNPQIRSTAIANLLKLVQEKAVDGINIDFELLKPQHKDGLNAFMAELYPQMKKLNKTVFVSVFPKVDIATDVTAAYDYPALAKNSDYLQVMAYDQHWATATPGPVAAFGWVEKNIQAAVEQAGNSQKVVVGIPAYGYDWPDKNRTKAETITYTQAKDRAQKKGAEIIWDDGAKVPHYKYDTHEVWFENADSTKWKLELVKKYNVAGIAIWRLGQEDPKTWDVINDMVKLVK